jgi:hypothetical protein
MLHRVHYSSKHHQRGVVLQPPDKSESVVGGLPVDKNSEEIVARPQVIW